VCRGCVKEAKKSFFFLIKKKKKKSFLQVNRAEETLAVLQKNQHIFLSQLPLRRGQRSAGEIGLRPNTVFLGRSKNKRTLEWRFNITDEKDEVQWIEYLLPPHCAVSSVELVPATTSTLLILFYFVLFHFI